MAGFYSATRRHYAAASWPTIAPPRTHARVALEAWRDDYNMHRPHSKLGWQTPADYARAWAENEELEGRPSRAFYDDRIPVPAG